MATAWRMRDGRRVYAGELDTPKLGPARQWHAVYIYMRISSWLSYGILACFGGGGVLAGIRGWFAGVVGNLIQIGGLIICMVGVHPEFFAFRRSVYVCIQQVWSVKIGSLLQHKTFQCLPGHDVGGDSQGLRIKIKGEGWQGLFLFCFSEPRVSCRNFIPLRPYEHRELPRSAPRRLSSSRLLAVPNRIPCAMACDTLGPRLERPHETETVCGLDNRRPTPPWPSGPGEWSETGRSVREKGGSGVALQDAAEDGVRITSTTARPPSASHPHTITFVMREAYCVQGAGRGS